MFGIGIEEIVLIFVIALFVFGPERLPSLARDIGKMVAELRKASDELTAEFLRADEPKPPPAANAPSSPELTPPAETPAVTAESTSGEVTTEFDKKAQADADAARAEGT